MQTFDSKFLITWQANRWTGIYLFICIYNFNLYLDLSYTNIVCIQTSLWTELAIGFETIWRVYVYFVHYLYIYIYIYIYIYMCVNKIYIHSSNGFKPYIYIYIYIYIFFFFFWILFVKLSLSNIVFGSWQNSGCMNYHNYKKPKVIHV